MNTNTTSPFKICQDEALGRYLMATCSLNPGDTILKESPLIQGPFLHTIPVCLGCGKVLNSNNSKPCTKCGWPLCSDVCENSPTHQPECTLTVNKGSKINIKNFGIPHPNYQFITILRSLYLKQSSPETWSKLMALQSHPNDLVVPPNFIQTFFKLQDWSEDEIAKVIGILTVNGHEFPLTQPPQMVVYHNASFFEHNCRANCTKTFTDDGGILVVASGYIQEGDHLSICYTDPFWGTSNRRHHLHQSKQFWCSCLRCDDPSEFGTHLNSIKCPNRPCDGYLLPKTFLQQVQVWNCNKCDGLFPNDKVELILRKIGVELAEMPKGDLEVCKNFLKKYDTVLTPYHFYMVDVKIALTHILGSQDFGNLTDDDLNLLLELCDGLRGVAEKIAPAERRFLGLFLHKHGRALIEMARRQEDQDVIQSSLLKSKALLMKASEYLSNESNMLPEGRLHYQIDLELKFINDLLNK